MILPVPLQASQVRTVAKEPNMVFCCTRTWPVPPQVVQVTGLVPGLAPVPPQVLQFSSRGIKISFLTPKADSSKVMV